MKKLFIIITIAILFASCKSISMNVAVPDQFAANATQMKVSGLNGWKIKPKLTFGNYQTSKIKKGWVVTTGGSDRNRGFAIEERVMRLFKMSRENIATDSKNKYKYTIQDGNLVAEVYCLENASREEITTKTPLGDFSTTKNFQYSFSAAILPQTIKDEPCSWCFTITTTAEKIPRVNSGIVRM
jgi:hypothetical protein